MTDDLFEVLSPAYGFFHEAEGAVGFPCSAIGGLFLLSLGREIDGFHWNRWPWVKIPYPQ